MEWRDTQGGALGWGAVMPPRGGSWMMALRQDQRRGLRPGSLSFFGPKGLHSSKAQGNALGKRSLFYPKP